MFYLGLHGLGMRSFTAIVLLLTSLTELDALRVDEDDSDASPTTLPSTGAPAELLLVDSSAGSFHGLWGSGPPPNNDGLEDSLDVETKKLKAQLKEILKQEASAQATGNEAVRASHIADIGSAPGNHGLLAEKRSAETDAFRSHSGFSANATDTEAADARHRTSPQAEAESQGAPTHSMDIDVIRGQARQGEQTQAHTGIEDASARASDDDDDDDVEHLGGAKQAETRQADSSAHVSDASLQRNAQQAHLNVSSAAELAGVAAVSPARSLPHRPSATLPPDSMDPRSFDSCWTSQDGETFGCFQGCRCGMLNSCYPKAVYVQVRSNQEVPVNVGVCGLSIVWLFAICVCLIVGAVLLFAWFLSCVKRWSLQQRGARTPRR
eukprot:TRINITY_DN5072_c0_g1_i2.p1 TRINITY_DN5072_c0_g1~~TRINITY_DN5072_c0_g1_i2.p1  ORF type:complete len:380 (-),score=49.35 TRINITY_DN5072_c0_g1_i2:103-1242(-)